MIKEITATNFLAFKQLHYVCSKLNLLTGVNGSGKSSFVKLLEFARKIDCQQEDSITCESISYDDVRYCYAPTDEGISFSVEFCDAGQPNQTQREAFNISKENGNGIRLERVTVGRTDRENNFNFGSMRFVSPYRDKPSAIYESRNLMALERGVDPIRFLCRPPLLDFDVCDYHGRGDMAYLSELGRNKGLWQNNINFPYNESLRVGDCLFDWVNHWLDRISPGASVATAPIITMNGLTYYQRVKGSIVYRGQHFKPENASLGVYYALPILVTVLIASPFDVLVIQNPEAFLHPQAQEVMGELFALSAASGVQLFVETHSEYIINAARLAVKNKQLLPEDVNIAVFRRMGVFSQNKDGSNDEGPSSEYSQEDDIKVRDNGELSDYPKDFMDEWANQLAELV